MPVNQLMTEQHEPATLIDINFFDAFSIIINDIGSAAPPVLHSEHHLLLGADVYSTNFAKYISQLPVVN